MKYATKNEIAMWIFKHCETKKDGLFVCELVDIVSDVWRDEVDVLDMKTAKEKLTTLYKNSMAGVAEEERSYCMLNRFTPAIDNMDIPYALKAKDGDIVDTLDRGEEIDGMIKEAYQVYHLWDPFLVGFGGRKNLKNVLAKIDEASDEHDDVDKETISNILTASFVSL